MGGEQVNLPSCHSTNQVAADLLSAGKAAHGMLVITDHQQNGRGQRGNSWESEPFKNLTFSLILTPRFLSVQRQFELTRVASLAILNTLKDMPLKDLAIKWPNDIICGDKKISGILIENAVRTENLESTIVGIGLNVNQVDFRTDNATSVALETKRKHNLQDILSRLLGHFEGLYRQLYEGGASSLKKEYERHLYWKGESHWFEDLTTKSRFRGSIQGTDHSGRLYLQRQDRDFYFDFKQIAFLE